MGTYYVVRDDKKDAIALLHINGSSEARMEFYPARDSRFGRIIPVIRYDQHHSNGRHIYNIMLGEHAETIEKQFASAVISKVNDHFSVVTKEEWETYDALELFPVLKTAIADGSSVMSFMPSSMVNQPQPSSRYNKRGRGW